MSDADRKARAVARRERMTIRKTTLAEQDAADPHPVRGGEAVSLVARLTRQAWALAGREWPRYARSEMPVRFVPGRPS